MTTYLPSGAPGSAVLNSAAASFRESTPPNGLRTPETEPVQLASVTADLKLVAAAVQLSPYFASSTSDSHDCAAAVAVSTLAWLAGASRDEAHAANSNANPMPIGANICDIVRAPSPSIVATPRPCRSKKSAAPAADAVGSAHAQNFR